MILRQWWIFLLYIFVCFWKKSFMNLHCKRPISLLVFTKNCKRFDFWVQILDPRKPTHYLRQLKIVFIPCNKYLLHSVKIVFHFVFEISTKNGTRQFKILPWIYSKIVVNTLPNIHSSNALITLKRHCDSRFSTVFQQSKNFIDLLVWILLKQNIKKTIFIIAIVNNFSSIITWIQAWHKS